MLHELQFRTLQTRVELHQKPQRQPKLVQYEQRTSTETIIFYIQIIDLVQLRDAYEQLGIVFFLFCIFFVTLHKI